MIERRKSFALPRTGAFLVAVLAAVVLLASPLPVRAANNVGVGEATGTITYPAGSELPPVLRVCQPTTFTIETSSAAFVFNTVISGYAGPVTIEGSGFSSCESSTLGGGNVSLSLEGRNPVTESELDCPNLVGGYTRVMTDMTLIMSGDCVVNRFGTGTVNFIARLQFMPMGGGAGFLAPVSSASVTGPFTISPA